MKPGDSIHVLPKTVHRMTAIEDCDVFEVSTPELDDVVRLEDRYGREGTKNSKSSSQNGLWELEAGRYAFIEPQNGMSSSVIGSIGGSSGRRLAAASHRGPCRRRRGTATAAAEQRDAVGLDLSGVALVAVLVVPLARLQTALDVDLFALGQVLLQALRLLAPEHDAVPLGLFLTLIVAVVPDLGRRQIERGHRRAAWRVAQLRVATQIADENHLVHAAHVASFRATLPAPTAAVAAAVPASHVRRRPDTPS